MNYVERIHKDLREFVSSFVLDAVEKMPKFQRGRIHDLQQIREAQRRVADKRFEQSKKPQGVSIRLISLSLVLCYEFEQFSLVHKSLKRAFPGRAGKNSAVDNIRKNENDIYGSGWTSIGSIIGEDVEHFISDGNRVAELPSSVESIKISHHRLLPSLACLEFTVVVSRSFQHEINAIASRYYLPNFVSSSLRPKKIFRGYSMSVKNSAEEEVSRRLRELIGELQRWLVRDLRLSNKHAHISEAFPLFEISFHNGDGELNDFVKSHQSWISKYGCRAHDSYVDSDHLVIFSPNYKQEYFVRVDPLFFLKQEHADQEMLIDGVMKGMVCSAAILNRVASYRSSIEHLRRNGLNSLNERWKIIRKSSKNIYSLKHLILRTRRLSSELHDSWNWLFISMDHADGLRRTICGNEYKFPSDTISRTKSELKLLLDSATIVDQALSDRLATENIYIMYRLQRGIFWLTVVGVVVAAVGLLAAWSQIHPLIDKLLKHISW